MSGKDIGLDGYLGECHLSLSIDKCRVVNTGDNEEDHRDSSTACTAL